MTVFEEERMFCIAGLLKIWEAFWDDFTIKPIFDTQKKKQQASSCEQF